MRSDPITDFRFKKLSEYLDGQKALRVLILFDWHGMGDCVMFRPLYDRLKVSYPDILFNLRCGKGQELFNDGDDAEFDLKFSITFPEFKHSPDFRGLSKPEICAVYELGIPFDAAVEFTWKPKTVVPDCFEVPDNTVGLAFQVTSNPRKSISEECAKRIWDTVKDFGYTPLEVHFEHSNRNSRNTKFEFIDNTCRDYPATIANAIYTISRCRGFIGVNTGTFCMATSMSSGKTLHLLTRYPFCPNYKRFNPVPELDCRDARSIDISKLNAYLKKL